MKMRIDICVVLVKGFIRRHNIELIGGPVEQYTDLYGLAQELDEKDVIDCLDRIEELGMIEHCFGGN